MSQTPRQFDRRALFATGSAAALLAAVGISAQAAPARGGHLRVALSGGDRAETWHSVPGGRFVQAARNAVFETLTEIAPDGTLQPGLAIGWQAQDGGARWTFTLRAGVTFHDGAPLGAEDVAASLRLHGAVQDVRPVAGGRAAAVLLHRPDPGFPFTAAQSAWSIFAASELAGGALPMLGTGLYRIARFDPGRGFLGRRVAAHRKDGAAGWFDSVELVAMSDEAVRAEAVRDGYVDAADLSHAHDLAAQADVEVMTDETGTVRGARRKTVLHPARLGPHPLDALHLAARWWMQA